MLVNLIIIPLSVQVEPGRELGVRVEYDAGVFDVGAVGALIGRLRRVLVAMTAELGQRS